MRIRYTVGTRAGNVADVDAETGLWMVAKRRAIEVPAAQDDPSQGGSETRPKRKYTRRVPAASPSGKGAEAST